MLSERHRFEIWKLARSLCHQQDVVTLQEVLVHCETDYGLTISVIYHEKLVGYEAFTFIQPDCFYIVTPPLKSDAQAVKHSWLRAVAHEVFHCYLAKHEVPVLDDTFPQQNRLNEARAHYFARVLLFHIAFGQPATSIAALISAAPPCLGDPKDMLNHINELRQNRILLLGRYPGDGGLRLRRIESALENKGLRPVIFGDLYGVDELVAAGRIKEEVLTVAKLSQFVIVEDSEASGHLIEMSDLGMGMVTTAVMRQEGMGSTILTASLFKKYGAFMKPFSYNTNSLSQVLDAVVNWAGDVD